MALVERGRMATTYIGEEDDYMVVKIRIPKEKFTPEEVDRTIREANERLEFYLGQKARLNG